MVIQATPTTSATQAAQAASTGSTKPWLVAITGPTASGKTDLAIALAKRLPFALVNMDAAQVYRGLDIGTAKITAAEQARFPHALLDTHAVTENYSAAQFVEAVSALLPSLYQQGKMPLLVGGSMLYYKALAEGLNALPSRDDALRADLNARYQREGFAALYQQLKTLDPNAPEVPENNRTRLIRLLEIALSSQQAPSALFATQVTPRFCVFHIKLQPENRAWLHQRIAIRFEKMLADGLLDEARWLKSQLHNLPDANSARIAGYRQALDYLAGAYDDLPRQKNGKQCTPEAALFERGVFAHRQLAKRQLTWLRKLPADLTFDPSQSGYSFATTLTTCLNALIMPVKQALSNTGENNE